MTISDHMEELGGKRIVDYRRGSKLPDPGQFVCRLGVGYEEEHSTADLLIEILQDPNCEQITGIVFGAFSGEMWDADGDASVAVEALANAASHLPQLRHVFVGDITFEECEMSWINQTDVSPVLSAYPRLQSLGVRGGTGLTLGALDHAQLQKLVVETGGLPANVLQEVVGASLPELTHLELWLGTDEYGWDGTLDDIEPLLSPDLFPKLSYLGLRNFSYADELVQRIVSAPAILEKIDILDLSLGTLGDAGAKLLLDCPSVASLTKLDLHHHYMTNETMAAMASLGVEVNVSDQEEEDRDDGDVYRFVYVGE